MGVLNTTPDSFSDGGRYLDGDAARARVDELLADGADIIDIGSESTRPGALSVSADEQIARATPALDHAVARGAFVSIDTASAEVIQLSNGLNGTTDLRFVALRLE
jgi:dihydropteroate synthase